MKHFISLSLVLCISACSLFEPPKRLNPLDANGFLGGSGGTFSIQPTASKTEITLSWAGISASNHEGFHIYSSTTATQPSIYNATVLKSLQSVVLTGLSPYTTNWNFWIQPYSNNFLGTAVKMNFDLGGVAYDTVNGHPSLGSSCLRFENIPKGFSRQVTFSTPNQGAVFQNVNEFRYYYRGTGMGSSYGALTLTFRIANSNITLTLKTNLPAGDVPVYNFATISNSSIWVPIGMPDMVQPYITVSNASDDDGTNQFFLDILSVQSNMALGALPMSNNLESIMLQGDLR